MKIIKVSRSHETWPYLRQTPDSTGVWREYKFIFTNKFIECDAWIVLGSFLGYKESAWCPPKNKILINGEPPTMGSYPDNYVRQFDMISTCSGWKFNHSNIKENPPILEWYYGVHQKYLHIPSKNKLTQALSYEQLIQSKRPVKSKLISVIINDKSLTPGHIKRREFVLQLKEHFGESLDIFGRSFRELFDKKDAIVDYRYHIVIENSSFKHYWSEKLADCFLGWAYPIYFGCPNLPEYFDSQSYTLIDLNDLNYSIKKIEALITNHKYENSLNFLDKSRNDILNKYNMFERLANILDDLDYSKDKEHIQINSVKGIKGYPNYLKNISKAKVKKYFKIF